jgi:hypothetical protein
LNSAYRAIFKKASVKRQTKAQSTNEFQVNDFSAAENRLMAPEKMPRKKFNKEQAESFWSSYTKNLNDSITETEKEGLEKGYSSYEIEKLWEKKTKEKHRIRTSDSKQ